MAYISELCTYSVLTKKTTNSLQIEKDYHFDIFRTTTELTVDWDILTQDSSLFLQRAYLEALENAAPKGYQFFYLIFYRDGKALGVAIAQHFVFKGLENISINSELGQIRQYLQSVFLKYFNVGFLTFGNATLTGEHGFTFTKSVPKSLHFELLHQGISKIIEEHKLPTNMLVIKDLFENRKKTGTVLLNRGFHEIHIQPTMLLDISSDWNSFDDYLAVLSSKYRVRAKRAFKKMGEIKAHWLDESEIVSYQKQLFQLYRNVADNADLNVMHLPENYFTSLKEKLGSDFKLLGYFLEGKLVGFCSVINNRKEVEAHFLGFDAEINYKHQLYLNMLFDIIRYSIQEKGERISFSRTALEIKSSVGAVPKSMYGYMRHRNSFLNLFIPTLFNWFGVQKDWVQRHPFK